MNSLIHIKIDTIFFWRQIAIQIAGTLTKDIIFQVTGEYKMSLIEILTLTVGPIIAKALLKSWLGDAGTPSICFPSQIRADDL